MEKSNTIKYVWQLENYSFCDFYSNEELESPHFTVHTPVPCKWFLYMFPNGCGIDKYVAIYLKRCSKDNGPKEIAVRFKISLLDSRGNLCPQTPSIEKVFTENCEWGHSEFIKRSQLITGSTFLYDDSLFVHCQITFIEPNDQLKIPRRQFSLQPGEYEIEKGVCKAIELIYEHNLFSDMTLENGSKTFRFHKCILHARLPGLLKKLESEPQTALSNDILTQNILLYAYSGKLDVKGVNPFKIRTSLSEYGLHHLAKYLTPQSDEFLGLTCFSVQKHKYSWKISTSLLSEEEEIISPYIPDEYQKTVFLARLAKRESGLWSINIKAFTSNNDEIFVRCNISVRDPVSNEARSVFVICEGRHKSDTWWDSPSAIQLENNTLIFNNESYVFDSGFFYIDFIFTFPSGKIESTLLVTTSSHSSITGCNINDTEGLLLDLERLYNSEYESDATIIAGSRQFKVHKCILCARSPYFRAMFTHDMAEKENNKGELRNDELDDSTFGEVVDKLLLFIYCGKFEARSPEFDSLLRSAIDMYLIGKDY